jgi:hypothetical protein
VTYGASYFKPFYCRITASRASCAKCVPPIRNFRILSGVNTAPGALAIRVSFFGAHRGVFAYPPTGYSRSARAERTQAGRQARRSRNGCLWGDDRPHGCRSRFSQRRPQTRPRRTRRKGHRSVLHKEGRSSICLEQRSRCSRRREDEGRSVI